MKNKAKVLIIDLSAGLLWFAAFVSLCLYAIFSLKADVVFAVCFSALGAVINYYLFVFFHELGHVVFSKTAALAPKKINYGLFTVALCTSEKNNNSNRNNANDSANVGEKDCGTKHKKITFSPFSGEAGVTEFAVSAEKIAKKEKNGKCEKSGTVDLSNFKADLKTVTAGGIIFSFVYCLISFFILLFVKEQILFCIFGAGACSAFYLFTINVLPINKTNDGSLVLFDGYCDALADMLEFSYLAERNESEKIKERFGKKEIADSGKKAESAFLAYILYSIDCNAGDVKNALFRFDNFFSEKSINKLSDEEYSLIFSETVFSACLRLAGIREANEENLCSAKTETDEKSKILSAFLAENKRGIENFFASCQSAPSEEFSDGKNEGELSELLFLLKTLRAHAAYRDFSGETEWANAIKNSYKKTLEKALLQKTTESEYFLEAEKNLSQSIK